MKQHITVDQIEQLNNKGKSKYKELKKEFGWLDSQMVWLNDNVWFLTIGQMIEILVSQRDKGLHMNYDIPYFHIKNKISHEEPGHMWSTEGWTLHYSQPNPWNKMDVDDTNEELCDGLWKLIKKILEQ